MRWWRILVEDGRWPVHYEIFIKLKGRGRGVSLTGIMYDQKPFILRG